MARDLFAEMQSTEQETVQQPRDLFASPPQEQAAAPSSEQEGGFSSSFESWLYGGDEEAKKMFDEMQREKEERGSLSSYVMEPTMSVLSSLPAEVAAGARGAYETLTGGDVGAGVEETREALTYSPDTERGRKALGLVGSAFEATGIPEGLEKAETYLGETAYEKTGSPALAAAAKSVPTAALEILGLIGLKNVDRISETAKEGAANLGKGVEESVKTLTGRPEIQVFDEAGEFTPEALSSLKEKAEAESVDPDVWLANNLKESGALTAEQAAEMATRSNLFKRRGVTPSRANITQATDDWRKQQELMKESGDVSSLVSYQDARLAELAREGKAGIGAVADDVASTNESISNVVTNIAEAADNAVTKAYQAARDRLPEDKNIKLDSFMEELRGRAGDEGASGNIISSIRGELRNRGVGKGFKAEGKIDVETSERIRQKLNELFANDSTTGIGKGIISDLKDRLDDDVAKVVGEDLFEDARRQKRQFHNLIERRKTSKFDRSKGSLLEDILYNKVDQNKINQKIKSARPEEFEHLQEFFQDKSGDAGLSAWQNLSASVFEEAIEKARGAKTEGGIESFNSNAFKKVFEPLKNSKASKGRNAETKFEAMFSPEEQSLINDIIDIGELRKPTKSVFAGEGPSARGQLRAVEVLLDRLPMRLSERMQAKREKKRIRRETREALATPEKEIERAIAK